MTTTHTFESTGDAYDACQCDDAIKDGDTLLIPSEGVVGIAHCWPVAVTEETGHLHGVALAGSVIDVVGAQAWRRAVAIAVKRRFPTKYGMEG